MLPCSFCLYLYTDPAYDSILANPRDRGAGDGAAESRTWPSHWACFWAAIGSHWLATLISLSLALVAWNKPLMFIWRGSQAPVQLGACEEVPWGIGPRRAVSPTYSRQGPPSPGADSQPYSLQLGVLWRRCGTSMPKSYLLVSLVIGNLNSMVWHKIYCFYCGLNSTVLAASPPRSSCCREMTWMEHQPSSAAHLETRTKQLLYNKLY